MNRMSREGKSSTPPKGGPRPITPADVLRQVVVIVLVLVVWSAVLVVYLGLTQPGEAPTAAPPQPTEVVVAATATAVPTATGTVPPADSPVPPEETAAATATEVPTDAPEASLPPPTPTPEPEATESAPTPTTEAEPTEPLPTPTATPAEVTGASFSGDVHPILTSRCERCHGSQRAEAGFRVSTYAELMTGSQNGPVVVPGSAATSRLVELIVSGEMPRRAPRLPDEEIQTIGNWIDAGALDN